MALASVSPQVFLNSDIPAATATLSTSEPWVGPLALSVAVLVDSVLPNIEELILRRYGRAAEEVMLFTQVWWSSAIHGCPIDAEMLLLLLQIKGSLFLWRRGVRAQQH